METNIDDIKHCLKVMVDCEVCEECNLYGTTGTDHCEHDCVYGALDIIDKYQMFQTKYVERLKADMVAMLEDLDLQIDEIPIVTRHGITGTVMTAQGMRKKIKENIQQKIDALKEQTDGNDSK